MAIDEQSLQGIHDFTRSTMDQLQYLEALFQAITRLDGEPPSDTLARLGVHLAGVLHNEVDLFDELAGSSAPAQRPRPAAC